MIIGLLVVLDCKLTCIYRESGWLLEKHRHAYQSAVYMIFGTCMPKTSVKLGISNMPDLTRFIFDLAKL